MNVWDVLFRRPITEDDIDRQRHHRERATAPAGRFTDVRHERGRTVEVESLSEFDERIAAGATTLAGWHIQELDLTDRGGVLRRVDPAGALFLGCTLDPDEAFSLRARGAPVFPEVPDVPVKQYRSALYTPAELFGGLSAGYHETLDARVYAWSRQPPDLDRSLAKALHDHAIDDALRNVVRGKTRTLPVWPALQALAAGRDMGPRVHLVDELDDAVARLVGDPAVAPGPGAE